MTSPVPPDLPSPLTARPFARPRKEGKGSALALAAALREAGLRVEWYPEADRLPKQLKYADRLSIPIAAILGPDELAQGLVALKNLRSGEQRLVARDDVAPAARAWLGRS